MTPIQAQPIPNCDNADWCTYYITTAIHIRAFSHGVSRYLNFYLFASDRKHLHYCRVHSGPFLFMRSSRWDSISALYWPLLSRSSDRTSRNAPSHHTRWVDLWNLKLFSRAFSVPTNNWRYSHREAGDPFLKGNKHWSHQFHSWSRLPSIVCTTWLHSLVLQYHLVRLLWRHPHHVQGICFYQLQHFKKSSCLQNDISPWSLYSSWHSKTLCNPNTNNAPSVSLVSCIHWFQNTNTMYTAWYSLTCYQ